MNGFSGTVLLASRGMPLFAKGVGYANIEWQIPNTPKTKFRIGSMTKQFTSMLVMQLREQGKIKLEDSVCVYVTPCPDDVEAGHDPSPAHAHVGDPDLHRHRGVAATDDGAEDDRADGGDLPRPAAAVGPGREIRLQQLRLLPPRRRDREGHAARSTSRRCRT